MSAYDLIIVGLGPAGSALGHRAQARGLRVLGIDPSPEWPNTYGLFRDELPRWLSDAPMYSACFPTAKAITTHQLNRQYCIIDNDAWRSKLQDFPILQEEACIESSTRVVAGGESVNAQVIVDARGLTYYEGIPVQQALGWFIPEDADDQWLSYDTDTGRFRYSFATPHGRLVEETLLVTNLVQPWQELEDALLSDYPTFVPDHIEKVLIPMGTPSHHPAALPFGARAGFINPISGYSLARSLSLVDATLEALWPTRRPAKNRLPWHSWSFRLDRKLCSVIQAVLTELRPSEVAEILEVILGASISTQRGFLTLGNVRGTVWGMLRVFGAVPWRTRWNILSVIAARMVEKG
ncbi:lycopene cyclase family protein [Staphylococcus chromogenes]|nr:lycopene cyclase family protein [Staphylococcus chromogenes]